jgi:nucleoside-diphosphate-sugar epimerase
MGLTSDLIEGAVAGRPFRLARGGDQKDDFIYNKDVALGTYLATVAKTLKHRVFNIGSGVGVTLREMAEILKGYFPRAEIEIGPGLNYLDSPTLYYSVYDISRARDELGYAPQYDLAKGVGDYLAFLEKNASRGA